jgi:hypothetical protein
MLFREYLLIHMSLTLIKILFQVYGSRKGWEADQALEAWKQDVTVQILLMHYLNRVHFDAPMSIVASRAGDLPLDEERYWH